MYKMAFCSDIASFVTHEVFPHCEYKCALKLFGGECEIILTNTSAGIYVRV